MPDVKTTWFCWHHLDIGMTTRDSAPVRAVLYCDDKPVGVSFREEGGWTDCPGTSPNVPLVLARMEDDINKKS